MYRSIAVISLLAFSVPSLAEGVSYNYVEGTYQQVDLDDGSFNVDGDGFGIAGSFEIGDQFHLFGGFNNTSFDFGVDLDEISFGGGFHTALTPNVDFVANLAWVRFDLGSSVASFDDDGIGASVGIRAMTSPKLELAGAIQYVEIGDGDDTSIVGELWYSITPQFAVGLNAGFGDDITRYGLGARVYFGN